MILTIQKNKLYTCRNSSVNGSDPELRKVNCVDIEYRINRSDRGLISLFTTAVLAQSVEHVTAELEVVGLIPGAGPILRVLK